jgi:hypothetical protein
MNCPSTIPPPRKSAILFALLVCLAVGLPGFVKTDVDFDPNLDFSKYKTFAFLGGVENLVMLHVNPELINNRVHRAVTREMTAKGLGKSIGIKVLISWCATGLARPSKSTWSQWGIGDRMARISDRIGAGCTTPCRQAVPRRTR